jgi:hypothetical protein
MVYRLKTARLDDQDIGDLIDNALGEAEVNAAGLIGVNPDQDYASAHDHGAVGGVQVSHVDLASKGTATHAQIDSHIASTSNPHVVTAAQAGADPAGTGHTEAGAHVAAHEAAGDPHTGYQKESEKGTAGGYAGLNASSQLAYNMLLNADPGTGAASGVVDPGVAGETLAFGDAAYYEVTTSRWWKTDADAAATAGPVRVAICLTAASAAGAIVLLDLGYIELSSWSWATVGAPVYLSGTAGALTLTAPTGTGKIVRPVGTVHDATTLFINAPLVWVELA